MCGEREEKQTGHPAPSALFVLRPSDYLTLFIAFPDLQKGAHLSRPER